MALAVCMIPRIYAMMEFFLMADVVVVTQGIVTKPLRAGL